MLIKWLSFHAFIQIYFWFDEMKREYILLGFDNTISVSMMASLLVYMYGLTSSAPDFANPARMSI